MWLVDKILEARDARVILKVLVHEAFFDGDPRQEPHYFVKVSNNSVNRDATITHIWVDEGGKKINIINQNTPLPQKLAPSDIWETWFRKDSVKDHDNLFKGVRVLTSNGKVYKSNQNREVPSSGFIAKPSNRL